MTAAAFLACLTCCAVGAPPLAELPSAARHEIDRVIADPALAGGFAGVLVIAAGTQAGGAGLVRLLPYEPPRRPELYGHFVDKLFTPASNAKLFTAAAALDKLGAGYRFVTTVRSSRPPIEGNVPDLYLVGGGDPSLDLADLRELAAALRAKGVRHVRGAVLADTRRYERRLGEGWAVDDLPWYYAPEITALAIERNQVTIRVLPGEGAGRPARAWCTPEDLAVPLRSTALTGPTSGRTAVEFDRPLGGASYLVRGTIPAGRTAEVTQAMALPDPPLAAAAAFRKVLAEFGVSVDDRPAEGPAPADGVDLATHSSAPLESLLQRLLKQSDNLYAEMLLRELGFRASGRGTPEAGAEAILAFLRAHDVSTDGLHLVDGSGLSRYDLVTPKAVAGVLRTMMLHRDSAAFTGALPVAGVDGTLSGRMKGTAAEGSVQAKTGFLSNNTSLSGYVTTRGRDLLIATTMFNHFGGTSTAVRALHDRVFVALAEAGR
ncbi:MAG: D-alanyl-D-alanine carboxypeptidase/D-alanyl-D-alanine-endopeptidase [Armatimonadetes bacterium]|nr:D-alanyl-D-alanine carboxypeptidase/D-alanyl-D-alanine-endopeptidase [Armatimonadota bacterium]